MQPSDPPDGGAARGRTLVSAYVPCFNNAPTVHRAIDSLVHQSLPPAEIIVVDDGSTDGSVEALNGPEIRIIRHAGNQGRGAVRARAMSEARHDLVVCCDATNVVEPRFIEKALPWFDDERMGAVVGRLTQAPPHSVAERWRGRHLFKLDHEHGIRHGADLATYGAVVRASAVQAVGGYDSRLQHTEDGNLGARLLARGFDVVYDPRIEVSSIAPSGLAQVLERYWRWYAGLEEAVSWRGYWKTVGYSIKSMALADLRAGDPLSVPVSLFCPHYQFWRSWVRRRRMAKASLSREGS